MSEKTETQIIEQVSRMMALVKTIVALVCVLGLATFWIAMMQFQLMALGDDVGRVKSQLERLTEETTASRERLIRLEEKSR
jgi:cell division protein FtsB